MITDKTETNDPRNSREFRPSNTTLTPTADATREEHPTVQTESPNNIIVPLGNSQDLPEMLNEGRNMRKALLILFYTGQVPRERMEVLKLSEQSAHFEDKELMEMATNFKSKFGNFEQQKLLPNLQRKEIDFERRLRERELLINQLENQVRSLQELKLALEQRVKERGFSEAQVEEKLEELRRGMTEEMGRLNEVANERVEDLSSRLKQTEAAKMREVSKVVQLKKDHVVETTRLEQRVAELAKQVESFSSGNNQTNNQVMELEAELKRLRGQNNEMVFELKRLRPEVEKRSQLEVEQKRVLSELYKVKDNLEETVLAKESVTKELKRVTSERDGLVKDHERREQLLTEEVERVREELFRKEQEGRKRDRDSDDVVSDLSAEVGQLRKALGEAEERVSVLEGEMAKEGRSEGSVVGTLEGERSRLAAKVGQEREEWKRRLEQLRKDHEGVVESREREVSRQSQAKEAEFRREEARLKEMVKGLQNQIEGWLKGHFEDEEVEQEVDERYPEVVRQQLKEATGGRVWLREVRALLRVVQMKDHELKVVGDKLTDAQQQLTEALETERTLMKANQKLGDAEFENKKLKSSITFIQTKQQVTQQANDDLQRQTVEGEGKRVLITSDEAVKLKVRVEELEKQLESAKSEGSRLRFEVQGLKEKMGKMQSGEGAVRVLLEKAQKEAVERQSEVEEWRTKVGVLEERLASEVSQLNKPFREGMSRLKARISEEASKSGEDPHTSYFKMLQQGLIVEQLTSENEELRHRVHQLEGQLECATDESEKVMSERLGFREEVDKANDRVKAMEGECAQFVDRIAQQNQQLREAETTVVALQQKVMVLGQKVDEQDGQLMTLREYKAVNERFSEENRNLVAVKVDLFNCKQAIENLQTELLFSKQVEKNLENEVMGLKSQLRESADAVKEMANGKNELWNQMRQQMAIADDLRVEGREKENLVKLTETKCRFLEQKVKDLEKEVKESEERVHEMELQVAECGAEDPRLTIQTRMQEREVREYSLINRELQGQLSRALVEVRTLEKENGKLGEELRVMAESDVAVILQQLRDKDNQIMEMIKVTNERVEELGVVRRQLIECQQQVVQEQHRVGLMENRVGELLEKRRDAGWMVAKFVEAGRKQLGVSEEQEGSLEELMLTYRKIDEQRDIIEVLEDSTGQSISKHPLVKKKDMRISSLEESLQSTQEKLQFMERRNQRLAEEVLKQELAVEAKRSQVAKLDDEVTMLNERNGELVFMVESLKGDNGEALAVRRQLENQKDLLKKEIEDLTQIHRVNALNLTVVQADLLIEQEKHSRMLGENQLLKKEVEKVKEANMQLQEGLIDNTEGFFNKISELDDKVGELELLNARLETRNNEMEGVMEELREKVREQEALAEGLRLKNEYLVKQNDKYANMMELPKDFVTKLTNYDDFIDKFNGLMEENVMKEQKVQSLENRLDRLLTKHPQLREESQGDEEKSHVSSDSEENEVKRQRKFATAVDNKSPLFADEESGHRWAEVSRRLEMVESENKQLKQNLSFHLNSVKQTDSDSAHIKGNFGNVHNNESLMSELASKTRKIESFGLTMNRMHDDYQKLREQLHAVEDELKQKELELKRVKEEQMPLHVQIAELKSVVEVKRMGDAKDESEATVKLTQLLRDKDRHLKEVLGEMQRRVEGREKEVERLKGLLVDSVRVKEELRGLREECGKLEMKLESARQSVTGPAELEGMRVIFVKLEGEIRELKQQLGVEKALSAKQATQLESAEMMTRTREHEVKSLQGSLASQKAVVEGLQQELTYYRKVIPIQDDLSDDAMLRKLQLKDMELHRLKITLKEQGDCFVELQDQKRSLSDKEVQLKKLVSENNKLAAELIGKRKDVDQLSKEVEDLATQQVILKDKHQLVIGRLGKAVEAVGVLDKSNQTLRDQLRGVVGMCNESNHETREAIRDFDFEVQMLNQMVEEMKERRKDHLGRIE